MSDAAAKKIQKAIAAIAAGGNNAEKKMFRDLSSLDNRLSKPEIRGDRAAFAKCGKVVSALRKSVEPAIEAGRLARAAERDRSRLASLGAEQEEKRGRSNADVAARQYEKELAIERGRR